MSSSKRERILQAVADLLKGSTGAGQRVFRSRVEALSRGEHPALVVEPITDEHTTTTSLPTLTSVLTVRIGVLVQGDPADQSADPIIVDMHRRLMGDLTIGGLAMSIFPAVTTFEIEKADVGVVVCDYRVAYRTVLEDLAG